MADAHPTRAPQPAGATGVVVFADGRTVWGQGFGAEGEAVGELCFNTAMTGYQEVMTDPSYAKQVIAFTFRTSAMSAPMTRMSKRSRRMRSAAWSANG